MGTQSKKVPFDHKVHLALVVCKLFINRLSTWATSYKLVECHVLSQRKLCVRSFLFEDGRFCHRYSSNLNFGFKG